MKVVKPHNSLTKIWHDVSPESSLMLFLTALMMGIDSLAQSFRCPEILQFCANKIHLYADMIPRGPVSASSFAFLELLRHSPNVRMLLHCLPNETVQFCIKALDDFCNAVDWELTELEISFFPLGFEARESVTVYRETLRDNFFKAWLGEQAVEDPNFPLIYEYKPTLDVICCGFSHHPEMPAVFKEKMAWESINSQFEASQKRILMSPKQHPVSQNSLTPQSFTGELFDHGIWKDEKFLNWMDTEPKTTSQKRELSQNSTDLQSINDGNLRRSGNSEDLLTNWDQDSFLYTAETVSEANLKSGYNSLEGFSLVSLAEEAEEFRGDSRKTYAQVCNEKASSSDKNCVEGRLMQSFLDATWAFDNDQWNTGKMTGDEMLKKTLSIFTESNPGVSPPSETVSLIRLISNLQCVSHLEEPDVSSYVPLRPVGSVELMTVKCSRWDDEPEKILNSENLEGVSHRNLRYFIPQGDRFQLPKRVPYVGRVVLTVEESEEDPQSHRLVLAREFLRHSDSDYCIRRLEDFTRQIRREPSHLAVYDSFMDTDTKWILVRDVCDWNLNEYIERELTDRDSPQVMDAVTSLFYQLLKGLEFMHQSVPILFHGNLKPNNVLIDSHGIVRLVDFGFGKLCAQRHNTSGSCVTVGGRFHPICWKPPEFFSIEMKYHGQSDMHSTAMIAFYMMTGGRKHPFVTHPEMSITELSERVLNGHHCIDGWIPCDARSLLESMLLVNPKDRPSAAAVMKHPFFWPRQKRIAFLLTVSYCLIRNRLCADPGSLMELDKTFAANKKVGIAENWRTTVPQSFHDDVELLRAQKPSVVHLLLFVLEVYRKASAMWKLEFFLEAYPDLFMTVFCCVQNNYFWKNAQKIKEFFM